MLPHRHRRATCGKGPKTASPPTPHPALPPLPFPSPLPGILAPPPPPLFPPPHSTHSQHTGRSLRAFFIGHAAFALAELSADLTELSRGATYKGTQRNLSPARIRLAAAVPALLLGVSSAFEADTPHEDDEEGEGEIEVGGVSGVSTGGRLLEARASFASKLSFAFIFPVLRVGRGRSLEHADLPTLDAADKTASNFATLSAGWRRSVSTHGLGSASFFGAFVNAFGGYFARTGLIKICVDCCTLMNPLLIHAVVSYIDGQLSAPPLLAIGLALAMFAANSSKSLLAGQYFFRGFRLGMRAQVAVAQMVFTKALVLSPKELHRVGIGAIVSHMQIDAEKISNSLAYMHLLWSGPLQLLAVTGNLFSPTHPFLPYVAPHFSHISPLILVFQGICFRPPTHFLPYVAPHFSHISHGNLFC